MAGKMAVLHQGSGPAGVNRPTRAAWQPHCQYFRHSVNFGSLAVVNHCHVGSASGARSDVDGHGPLGGFGLSASGKPNRPGLHALAEDLQ